MQENVPSDGTKEEDEEDMDAEEEDSIDENDDDDERTENDSVRQSRQHQGHLKRKLDLEEVEERLSSTHKDFQSFRYDLLFLFSLLWNQILFILACTSL